MASAQVLVETTVIINILVDVPSLEVWVWTRDMNEQSKGYNSDEGKPLFIGASHTDGPEAVLQLPRV